MREIYLAGGCFWGAEHFLKQIRGVVDTDTGFANGKDDIVSPTYEQVYTDQTGYAETVRVRYDEHVVGLRFLARMFFRAIDPTSLNKQGEDEGTRYRTGVYYTDKSDLPVLREVFEEVAERVSQPLRVELEPLRHYYSADARHQDYLDNNPSGYCHLPLSLFKYAREVEPQAPSAWDMMIGGQVYDACDAELLQLLGETRMRIRRFNELLPNETHEMESQLCQLFRRVGENPMVNQPLRVDYGRNIRVGNRFFANFGLTILDEAPVTIGDDVFLGPNVSLYTACHSTDPVERNTRREWALPITIGSNVWIGGSVTILPGVTIGDNVTIGAGSVVTRDIPANTVAVGNPARVIKRLSE